MTGVATDPEFLRAVFEETGEGYVIVDDEGRCVEASKGASTVLGVERDRLDGAPIREVAPGATDLDFTRGSATTANRAGDSGDDQPAGQDIETATAAVARDRHLVAVRDATEDRPSDDGLAGRTRLLARAYAASTVGVVVVAGDDEVVSTNAHANRLLGVAQDGAAGRRFADLPWADTHDERGALSRGQTESDDAGRSILRRVRETRDVVFDLERAIERPDGSTAWLTIDGAPVGGPATTDRVLLTLEDVTPRLGYRRLLASQNDRLDAYSETVNHDLRGPLSIAHGWLEVAIEDGQVDGLEKAKNALDRMADHMDELRDVARYSRTARDLSAIPVLPVAESAWSDLDPDDATLDVVDDLGTVHADRERLHALFEALFRNALEHTDGDVTVRVGPLDSGFYVADDGDGLSPDVRERGFEWGFSTTDGGFGLGLPLVAAIADAHGWTVSVGDAEPSGARFEFRSRWHPDLDD